MTTENHTDIQSANTLNAKLTQAQAIVTTLETLGLEALNTKAPGGHFECGHQAAMGMLWTLRDLLDAAQAAHPGKAA